MEGMGVRSETGSWWNDDVDDRLDREREGEGGRLEWSDDESSPESLTDIVDGRATRRLPLRWRAECRALARHRAVARAHSRCFAFASLSFSISRIASSESSVDWVLLRRLFRRLFSTSLSLFFHRIFFRQNRHPMMRKLIKKASTSEMARMSIVLAGRLGAGFHPGGRLLSISALRLLLGMVEFAFEIWPSSTESQPAQRPYNS